MDLRKLALDTKSVWMAYDEEEFPGFEVEVVNLSRKELTAMRKSCITQKFSRKERGIVENFNEKKFIDLFTEKTVVNWKGLTVKYVSKLMLMNTEGLDLDAEVEFEPEQAKALVEYSTEFDQWLNDVVFDLDNFRN